MKKHPTTVLAFVILALSLATGCKQEPSAFPLSLATLEKIHLGQIISYEERDGRIFVSISDSSGDSHIHRLDYSGHSIQDAFEILKKKQAELVKPDHQDAAAMIQKNGGEKWTILAGDWPVDAKDIPGILSGSEAYLESLLAGTPSDRDRDNLNKILADWDSYSCQLQPLLDRKSGAKRLGMQFFPTRDGSGMFKNWRTEPVLVEGGGYRYWNLNYDPRKREYSGFSVNATQ